MFGFNPSPFLFGQKKRLFEPSAQLLAVEAGAVFYMDARKISSGQPGSNDPVTTAVTDLSGTGNNATISNLDGSGTDGYVTINDMPYLRTDGSSTYGTITAHSSLDINGDQDFALCWGGILTTDGNFLFARGGSTTESTQFGLRFVSPGVLYVLLEGYTYAYATPDNSIPFNEFVRIEVTYIRGILTVYVKDKMIGRTRVDLSLTTQSNIRLFCRPDGSNYFVGSTAYFAIFEGANVTNKSITKFADAVSRDYVSLPAPTVYYVANDGDDADAGTLAEPFATVQKAFNTAKCGDTIYVRAGTYSPTERIQLPASGRYKRPITLKKYPSDAEKAIFDGTNADWGYNWHGLIDINAQDYVTIDGIRIIDSRWAGISCHSDYLNSVGLVIRNCETYNTQAGGISFKSCQDVVIDNNSIEAACYTIYSEECISMDNVQNLIVSNNLVFNIVNSFDSGGGEGIDIKNGCANVKVYGNTVHDCPKHSIYIDSYSAVQNNIEVFNNTVYNSDGAITVAVEELGGDLSDVVIRDNTIYDSNWGLIIGGWGTVRTMSNIVFRNNNVDVYEYAFWIGNPDAEYITIKDNYLKSGSGFPSMYLYPNHPDGLIDISTYTIDGNQITGVYAGHPTGTNYTIIS